MSVQDEEVLLSKSELEAKITQKLEEENFTFLTKDNSKTKVWQNFEIICYKGVSQKFARCIKCKLILGYKSKTGTASLLRHKCIRPLLKLSDNQSSLDTFLKTKKLNDAKKKEIANMQLYFIARDLRPVDVTEGDGFLKFCQYLINTGSDYGKLKITDVLSSRRTIMRTVIPQKVEEIKESIRREIGKTHVSLTSDLWTDDFKKRSYLTLTGHLINDNFDLKSFVFGTREFEDQKTGENIINFVSNMLKEYVVNTDEFLIKSIIVTDNGANIVSAFRSYKRLSCACHNLNLIVHDIIKCFPGEVLGTVESIKKLVKYFKQSGLNSKLSKSLKQDVATRWNSLFIMLNSVDEMYDEIQHILCEAKQLNRLVDIDVAILKMLLKFLNLFKDCSEHLSAENNCTINEVLLWHIKLNKHCNDEPEDSDILKDLKQIARNSIKKRFIIDDLHKIGLFLDPNFKSLKFLSKSERDCIFNLVANTVKAENINKSDTDLTRTRTSSSPSPAKKTKLDVFKEFVDSSGSSDDDESIEEEIKRYISLKLHESTDILSFWKTQTNFLNLKLLAKKILNIPASSAASERVFSISGRLLEERRTALKPSNLDYLLFLNKNYNVL